MIKIEYFFEDLLYLELPKVGKHLKNGIIYLQTENLEFPYYFTLKTASKKEKYKIEFSPEHQLNMNSIKVQNLKKIQIETKKPSIKLKERSQLAFTKISSMELKKITINKKTKNYRTINPPLVFIRIRNLPMRNQQKQTNPHKSNRTCSNNRYKRIRFII